MLFLSHKTAQAKTEYWTLFYNYYENTRAMCMTLNWWVPCCTFPKSSCRPKIWAKKTPAQMKMLGMSPRKPLRFLGAISPRYMGTTLREIPGSCRWAEHVRIYSHQALLCYTCLFYSWDIPECIPVIKRPKMTISGEPQILLNPMSDPAKNTSTVELTTDPFLQKQTLWSSALALLIKLGQSCLIAGHLGV